MNPLEMKEKRNLRIKRIGVRANWIAFSYQSVARNLTRCILATGFCMLAAIVGECDGLAVDDDRPIVFNRDIRPILSDKCFRCHGPDEESREADLRFDLKSSAFQAIEPGSLEDSELYHRILDEDPDSRMPPTSLTSSSRSGVKAAVTSADVVPGSNSSNNAS